MAIYHFSSTIISRKRDQSSVSTSAYRAAEKIHGKHTRTTHHFIKFKPDLIHQTIPLPLHVPAWMANRAKLWSCVERKEKRKDAQDNALEPQGKIGPPSSPFYQAHLLEHQHIAQRNGQCLLKDPSIAFKTFPQGQSSFSDQNLTQFVCRHSVTDEQFDAI